MKALLIAVFFVLAMTTASCNEEPAPKAPAPMPGSGFYVDTVYSPDGGFTTEPAPGITVGFTYVSIRQAQRETDRLSRLQPETTLTAYASDVSLLPRGMRRGTKLPCPSSHSNAWA